MVPPDRCGLSEAAELDYVGARALGGGSHPQLVSCTLGEPG